MLKSDDVSLESEENSVELLFAIDFLKVLELLTEDADFALLGLCSNFLFC